MCACVCVSVLTVCEYLKKKKNPDKALIITEEQGHVDEEVLIFFSFFLHFLTKKKQRF